MNTAAVAAFKGAVRLEAGVRQLRLYGVEQGTSAELIVTFGGYHATALPAVLSDLRVVRRGSAGNSGWQLQSITARYDVEARSLHVHRPIAREFFGAVPAAEATLRARCGWALLLNVLRIPGAAWLLNKIRSR